MRKYISEIGFSFAAERSVFTMRFLYLGIVRRLECDIGILFIFDHASEAIYER